MSFLHAVRERKKSRVLGEVRVVRRSEYEELDLDAKVEPIRELIPLGLMHIQELLDDEVSRRRGTWKHEDLRTVGDSPLAGLLLVREDGVDGPAGNRELVP